MTVQKDIEKATFLFRRTLPELKEFADSCGDDHSVGVCSCDLYDLHRQIVEWLHDYAPDEHHKPHKEVVEVNTDTMEPVWADVCAECGKRLQIQ